MFLLSMSELTTAVLLKATMSNVSSVNVRINDNCITT